jgi:YggT family protein
VLTFAIFLRVILSWFTTSPNTLTNVLDTVTEPVLAPLRRVIPRAGVFDFSPMVAIILLQLIAVMLP